MQENNWLTALGTWEWTSIIVAVITLVGGVVIAILDANRRRRQRNDTDAQQPTDSVNATYDPSAMKMTR